uniref:Uncharacterized protein n=1 Tax=Oryza glumipatula TaxID=40148 RepID=A0A0E0B477_9ORYZ
MKQMPGIVILSRQCLRKGLPISRFGDEDFASWPHDKHGTYTVRSAYNLARERVNNIVLPEMAEALAIRRAQQKRVSSMCW